MTTQQAPMIKYTVHLLSTDHSQAYNKTSQLIKHYRQLVEHIPNWHVELQEDSVQGQPIVRILMSFETIYELSKTDKTALAALKYAAESN